MTFEHIENIKVKCKFSPDKKYRYSMEISSTDHYKNKSICVIMQNPSVADENIADRSVQFIEKLILLKNYSEFEEIGKICIVNQFAYIQTNDFEGTDLQIGLENDQFILNSINKSDLVLVAWGISNIFQSRIDYVNSILVNQNNKLLYKTKRHPSRGTYYDFIDKYQI